MIIKIRYANNDMVMIFFVKLDELSMTFQVDLKMMIIMMMMMITFI